MEEVDRIKEDRHIYEWVLEKGINEYLDPIARENYTAILNIYVARMMLADANEALDLVSRFPTVGQIATYGYTEEYFNIAFNMTIDEAMNRINRLRVSALKLQRNCNSVLKMSYIILMLFAQLTPSAEYINVNDFMSYALMVTNNEETPKSIFNILFRGVDGGYLNDETFHMNDENFSNFITAYDYTDNNRLYSALSKIGDILKRPYSASIDLNMDSNSKLFMIQEQGFTVDFYRLYGSFSNMYQASMPVAEIMFLTNPQVLTVNAPNRRWYPYTHYEEGEFA